MLQHAPHGPTMAATPHPAMAATAHPRHGRHSTGTPAMGRTDHSTSARHRPPPCRHGCHNTRQHPCWPCCPMGATARPHHGCQSTPPSWAPQHTPSEMAAWPWPATAPTCPLAQWLTVGRLLAPWAHWWGPHALGGCFAFFSPLCWVQLRARFLLGTLTILEKVAHEHGTTILTNQLPGVNN